MAITKDQVKTPAELKEFLRCEMAVRNPKLLADFDEIWSAMSGTIVSERAVQKFLEGYYQNDSTL